MQSVTEFLFLFFFLPFSFFRAKKAVTLPGYHFVDRWISRNTTKITQVLSSMRFLSHATQHLADLPLSAKLGQEYSVAKRF